MSQVPAGARPHEARALRGGAGTARGGAGLRTAGGECALSARQGVQEAGARGGGAGALHDRTGKSVYTGGGAVRVVMNVE